MGRIIPYIYIIMMENKKCLKPSTSHCSIHFKTAKLPSQLYFEIKWNGELQRACTSKIEKTCISNTNHFFK